LISGAGRRLPGDQVEQSIWQSSVKKQKKRPLKQLDYYQESQRMDYWESARSSFHHLRVGVFEVTDSGFSKSLPHCNDALQQTPQSGTIFAIRKTAALFTSADAGVRLY
jgi:hypothetical protein